METTSRTWRPLLVCLVLQTALLVFNLGMLSAWGDESFTLDVVVRPVPELLSALRADIHPPLYFLLLQAWLQLLLYLGMAGSLVARVRLFSVLWTLLATAALDRLWAVRLPAPTRRVFLALWCTSPALLLYGRMARSYSMQVAVAAVALAAAWRWMRSLRARDGVATAAALVLTLYTHYVPGLAVAAAVNGALLERAARTGQGRRIVGQLALVDLIVAVAYAPWLLTLQSALARWIGGRSYSAHYWLTGSRLAEHAVRIAFTLTSFSIGETFPFVSLLVLAGIAITVPLSARASVHRAGLLGSLVLLAGVAGYFGVAGWASYPFMSARLLWLLPFFLLWLAIQPGVAGRWRLALLAGVLASNAWSIVNYFQREDFLNKGYALPMPAMADLIHGHSGGAPALVLLDGWNTDAYGFLHVLGNRLPSRDTGNETLAGMLQLRQQYGRIWIVRNTHDVSPDHVTERVENAACAGRARHVYGFLPYAWWERRALGLLRLPEVLYFYTVTECASTP